MARSFAAKYLACLYLDLTASQRLCRSSRLASDEADTVVDESLSDPAPAGSTRADSGANEFGHATGSAVLFCSRPQHTALSSPSTCRPGSHFLGQVFDLAPWLEPPHLMQMCAPFGQSLPAWHPSMLKEKQMRLPPDVGSKPRSSCGIGTKGVFFFPSPFLVFPPPEPRPPPFGALDDDGALLLAACSSLRIFSRSLAFSPSCSLFCGADDAPRATCF